MKRQVHLWGWLLLVGIPLGITAGVAEESGSVWLKMPETIEEDKLLWEGPLAPDPLPKRVGVLPPTPRGAFGFKGGVGFMPLSPEGVRQESPTREEPMTRDQTRRAQARLKAEGFDPGPLDGILGPHTQLAFFWYQRAHGLPLTGMLDEATANLLFANETSENRATPNTRTGPAGSWSIQALKMPDSVLEHTPSVSIGWPETWFLPKIYPPHKMPPPMLVQLQDTDFYLVRLYCSFRPAPGKGHIVWARFQIRLLPDPIGRQPIAVDLSPQDVTQELKRQAKFTLAPTLKFHEVEAQGGSYELILEYPELQPIIITAGLGETSPSWDYQIAKGIAGVQGSKWMHLLVKAPKGMPAAQAIIDVQARVQSEGLWSSLLWKPQVTKERLVVRLW